MSEKDTVRNKSKRFAVRIVRMYQYLVEEKREFVLSKQILRSGTSIGANVTEACYGASRRDFVAKLYIAYKEGAETMYWLELLYETGYLTKGMFESMRHDCDEIIRMLTATIKTIRDNENG
ncbi:MAG: four helix bundle protein [Ruminococcus sp.]|nr:four helix bundle protein [Ruminococcus sp.]